MLANCAFPAQFSTYPVYALLGIVLLTTIFVAALATQPRGWRLLSLESQQAGSPLEVPGWSWLVVPVLMVLSAAPSEAQSVASPAV